MAKFAIFAVLTLAAAGFGLYVLFPTAFKPSPGGGRKRWAYLFGGVLFAEMLVSVLAPLLDWWLPKGVSTYSWDIDLLFYAILGVTGVTFAGVSAVMVYILFKYPHEEGRRALYTHGNHKLEIAWSSIPGAILLLLAIVQIPAWLKVKAAANQSDDGRFLQMEVTARQWEWRVRYPGSDRLKEWADPAVAKKDFRMRMPARPEDVKRVNEIHCVKGQKVLVHLKTQDVIHSFFLPQMRLKQDALPGKTIPVWFQAEEANCIKDNGV
ncbi:MAG: cytochrome c oxidase subunit II, partial [Gemmataceae bacterium]